ncbi:hypothetical protein M0804_007724 [Polistes exclamans]|nr:hypothetical protein M0804_007724 [Polistes exclamans]
MIPRQQQQLQQQQQLHQQQHQLQQLLHQRQYSLPPENFNYNQERCERYQQQKSGYTCYKCGNHFTWRNNLYNHLKFQCGTLPRFNCPYCSYRTKHASNVRSHVRRIHPDEKVYVLDVYTKQSDDPKT